MDNIASSSDELTDSDDNYGCKPQGKTIPDCDTENAVTGIKIAPPGPQVNDVIGVNIYDTNQDIDAISHGVTSLNTCAKDQDVNSLNKTGNDHSVNGINNINTQDDDHDCVSSTASVVDGVANKDSAQTANSSSDMLSDLFFVCQPEKALYNMCKKDAMTRKPLVTVYRMDKDFIYTMSRSKPNWSDIDPYSSLEEASSSDTIILETDKDVGSKSEKVDEIRYELREHKTVERAKNVNVRTGKEINYKESSSDDDFVVKSKPKRNRNAGLRQPSENRLLHRT